MTAQLNLNRPGHVQSCKREVELDQSYSTANPKAKIYVEEVGHQLLSASLKQPSLDKNISLVPNKVAFNNRTAPNSPHKLSQPTSKPHPKAENDLLPNCIPLPLPRETSLLSLGDSTHILHELPDETDNYDNIMASNSSRKQSQSTSEPLPNATHNLPPDDGTSIRKVVL